MVNIKITNMKKIILNIIIVIIVSVLVPSYHRQTKDVVSEEKQDSIDEISMRSPYWYDKNQTEVTFSPIQDALLRYPREISDTSYIIPSSVRCIYDRAFLCCKNLKEITIPKTIQEIEMAAFDGCPNLERVYLYAQLDTIPFRFLNGCDRLRELHVVSKVPPVVDYFDEEEEFNFHITFGSANQDSLVLYVPYGAKKMYKSAYGWRFFRHIEEEPS